jgi:Fe2+ or Zn2+ uptake regulation protein
MRTTEELCQKFRSLGHKITPQRRFIFQTLEAASEHLSAEDVYQSVKELIPDISLATVYNTLRELVELGEVRELDLGEGKSRFDPITSDHQHLICVNCHELQDIDCELPEAELCTERLHGYRFLGADVLIYGLCPKCKNDDQAHTSEHRMWGVAPH